MKPKLAFVSLWNAAQPNAESGYPYSMRRQLQKNFDVVDLFPMPLPGERFWFPLRAGYKIAGRYYHPMREPTILKTLALRIERALRQQRVDIVYSPSSMPLTYLETKSPSVYATDQLFCDFVKTYISNPSERFSRLGQAQEARALASATRASFPSDWAASAAIKTYGADAGKVEVIPWGANLPHEIRDADVSASINSRGTDPIELVLIGRDWKRKGGDLFVATVQALNSLGHRAHGTIIGCDPPGIAGEFFTCHAFLNKANANDFARFSAIMLKAHFMLLPSRAEAYGQAFCEAAAFGVPSIGSTSGGIPTIIKDGETGFVRPADTHAACIAQLIINTLATPERYRQMALAAREDYCSRLNWDAFGSRISKTIFELL